MRPQMRIQAVAEAARHKMSGNVAMRDLAQRMHTGVGAARTMNANVLAADRLDRGFQRALHRGAIVLYLPAAERRAVIFDCQLVAGHIDPVGPSSSAKADDPVFRDVSVQFQMPLRTGYPACAGYDSAMRAASAASAACRAETPPPSSAARRRAAVQESGLRVACRQPRDVRRAHRLAHLSHQPLRSAGF